MRGRMTGKCVVLVTTMYKAGGGENYINVNGKHL
jgi:hypothetical protein